MPFDYNNIKNEIKNSGKLIYWYNEDGHLILNDSKKKESKNKIKKINYNGILYRLNITFHRGDKYGQGGPLAVKCKLFNKEHKTITKIDNNKNGIIYFEKDWLERKNWNKKWLDIIVKKLNGKFEFKLGVYKFNNII